MGRLDQAHHVPRARCNKVVAAIAASCITAIVSACSAPSGGITPPSSDNANSASTALRVVYSFNGSSDPMDPGPLISVGGDLYGTSESGGGTGCRHYGCGTVFKVSSSGQETVLHAFQGGSDGASPTSPLVEVNGNFFGTTPYGGGTGCNGRYLHGCGTIFEITAAGQERVLYRFEPTGSTGPHPSSGLTYAGGYFYGETSGNNGAIFKMSPAGAVSAVYAFTNQADGASPTGGLTLVRGNFYGTTGTTVFKVTPSGKETTISTFHNTDGGAAHGVAALNGDLYGVLQSASDPYCPVGAALDAPCGDAFAITMSGPGRIIHRFNGHDGAFPNSLMAAGGKLYGTTFMGGSKACEEFGCGTIFELTPSGAETVLYRFMNDANGGSPFAAPVFVGGVLYGTARGGGANGRGVVYALTP